MELGWKFVRDNQFLLQKLLQILLGGFVIFRLLSIIVLVPLRWCLLWVVFQIFILRRVVAIDGCGVLLRLWFDLLLDILLLAFEIVDAILDHLLPFDVLRELFWLKLVGWIFLLLLVLLLLHALLLHPSLDLLLLLKVLKLSFLML